MKETYQLKTRTCRWNRTDYFKLQRERKCPETNSPGKIQSISVMFKYSALVLTQTSFPKVSQVGIRASSLGYGGSFRLMNLRTNWRQERASGTEPTISSFKEKENAKRPIKLRKIQSISVIYSAIVFTQTSCPKVSQVGIRASSLGYGGSFRLMNLRTNWRQERASGTEPTISSFKEKENAKRPIVQARFSQFQSCSNILPLF